jgi:hypothetical protein
MVRVVLRREDVMPVETANTITVSAEELVKLLEPVMRRIVREELAEFAVHEPEAFRVEPGSPLYESLVNILRRKAEGKLRFYTHEEVFGE